MKYLSVSETAKRWGLSERTVRNYCNTGRVAGAVLKGKTWSIPADAEKPARKSRGKKLPMDLLGRLRLEKESQLPGGIYHKVQIDLTYNSNHIEGSRLTHDQTQYIFETNTIGVEAGTVNVDDILETTNHFRCIDLVIEQANQPLCASFLKQLHRILKAGTSDSRKSWFAVGDYKRLTNEVGGMVTASPEDVPERIKELLTWYGQLDTVTLDDLLEFHYQFEQIHPFQDGNGRVGRLILFKECLRNQIVPFIITDDLKLYYYRGLKEWPHERGYLRDTCLTAQDRFKQYLNYFKIEYAE
jgi:Fic family protein